MFDPTDHPRAAHAYRLGATVAEVESCSSEDELRELVLVRLRERSHRELMAIELLRLRRQRERLS